MLKLLIRLLLAIGSTALIIFVYLVKSQIYIVAPSFYTHNFYLVSLGVYMFMYLLFNVIILNLTSRLGYVTFKKGTIIEMEHGNEMFLPSYLGYFFVALDIPDMVTFWWVYGIILCFTYFSQNLYFNPVFLLLGFRFYYLTNSDHVKCLVISRRRFLKPSDIHMERAYQLHDNTYVHYE